MQNIIFAYCILLILYTADAQITTLPSYKHYPDLDNLENRMTLKCEPATYDPKKHGELPSCRSLVRPVQAPLEWEYPETVLWKRVVNFPYKVFYYGLDAPEGLGSPDTWVTYSASDSSCPNPGVCMRAVKCFMYQEIFAYAVTKWEEPGYTGAKEYVVPKHLEPIKQIDMRANGWVPWAIMYNRACVMCQPRQCMRDDGFACPNGRVSRNAVSSNSVGVSWGRPNCEVLCEPGTWLTCPRSSQCSFISPSTFHLGNPTLKGPQKEVLSGFYEEFKPGGVRLGNNLWGIIQGTTEIGTDLAVFKRQWIKSNMNSGMNTISMLDSWPLPVGACYPCLLANGILHNNVITFTDSDLLKQGFLKFFCPGESSMPIYCDTNKVSRINPATNRSGVCECMNGYHMVNGNCEMCPAGFYCKWSGLTPPTPRECDTDQYSREGWTDCKACTKNTAQCTSTEALTRCQRNGKGTWQKEDARCISCQQCQQVTNAEGSVPCYRVTAAYDLAGGVLAA
jgi:hypothetical protein